MRTNEHTYATIKRLHNQELYKVTIKRTWDTNGLFGIKSNEYSSRKKKNIFKLINFINKNIFLKT